MKTPYRTIQFIKDKLKREKLASPPIPTNDEDMQVKETDATIYLIGKSKHLPTLRNKQSFNAYLP